MLIQFIRISPYVLIYDRYVLSTLYCVSYVMHVWGAWLLASGKWTLCSLLFYFWRYIKDIRYQSDLIVIQTASF